MAVNPIPKGFSAVTPLLVVRDAASAIDFYARAFGAKEVARLVEPASGKIAHAEIQIGDSIVMLTDEFPEWKSISPQTLGGTGARMHLYVDDADAVADRAVAAGATVQVPVADQFYGDRSGRVEDPFGHQWIIGTHTVDMPVGEMQQRFQEFMQQQQ